MSSQIIMNRTATKMGKTDRYAGERRSKDICGSVVFTSLDGLETSAVDES